jgi:ABC-2 type transport system ATP-binding protein
LRFHAALAGVQNSLAEHLIPELLNKVQLNGYEKLKISKYSRGMVQRLGIAQALIGDPQLLILDEPTSGLDPAGRKEVRDLISSLKNAGKTILLSSHILSEVEQIADRVVIVDRGRLLRTGTIGELLSAGDRVELVADHVPGTMEQVFLEWGAAIERGAHGVRISIPATRKRQLAEMLWSEGCDVISIAPVKSSLEELFLAVVGGGKPS